MKFITPKKSQITVSNSVLNPKKSRDDKLTQFYRERSRRLRKKQSLFRQNMHDAAKHCLNKNQIKNTHSNRLQEKYEENNIVTTVRIVFELRRLASSIPKTSDEWCYLKKKPMRMTGLTYYLKSNKYHSGRGIIFESKCRVIYQRFIKYRMIAV